MTEAHLSKELVNLQERFPGLDRDYLSEKLRKHGGHAGKTTQYIFKEGGEGVEEAEEKFYKKHRGCFLDREVSEGHMVYLWDTRYDGSLNRYRKSMKSKDLDGNDVVLFECNSLMICEDERDTKYPNYEYFNKLACSGEPCIGKSTWGTDMDVRYDEFHPLNTEGKIMTIHELHAIIHVWKMPLLGIHPYWSNEKKDIGLYCGVEARHKKKEKLPEGWTRMGSEDYNGRYCYYYNDGDKKMCQWDNPCDK